MMARARSGKAGRLMGDDGEMHLHVQETPPPQEESQRGAVRARDTELGGSPWDWQISRENLHEVLPDVPRSAGQREDRRLPLRLVEKDKFDAVGGSVLTEEMLSYLEGLADPVAWMRDRVREFGTPEVGETYARWIRLQRRVAVGVAEVSEARRLDLAGELRCSLEELGRRVEVANNILRLVIWSRTHRKQAGALVEQGEGS